MVFTKGTNSDIKTSEYSRDLRKFFLGDLDNHEKSPFEKQTEKKKLRENLIQIILERYPLNYNKDTKFYGFSTYELNSIMEYGDPRATIDPEILDIDNNTSFYEDPNGVLSISHNEIDLEFRDKHQQDIAKQLKGLGMLHSLRVSRPRLPESKHLARMRDYKRIMKALPIKYHRAREFLINEKLEELAISSLDYYSKKARMYLAAVIILLMRTYQDGVITSIGIKDVCQDLCINSNGFIKYFQIATDQFEFLNTRAEIRNTGVSALVLKKRQIKTTAKNYIYQFAQEGYVENPSVINEFIEEIENHYNNIFHMKNKKEKVLALLAAKLFEPHLKISELAFSLYNGGVSLEDANNVDLLTKQVKSWMRINNRKIGNDVKSGRIRNLYISEIELVPEPQIIEIEVLTDNSTVHKGSSNNGQIDRFTRQSSFEVHYEPFSDKIILSNDLDILDYLFANDLLDQTTVSKGTSGRKSRRKFRQSLKMNLMVESTDRYQYDWDQGYSFQSPYHSIIDEPKMSLTENYLSDHNQENVMRFQSDPKSSVTIIDHINAYGDDKGKINNCFLGYPGATTRLFALLSLRASAGISYIGNIDGNNNISSTNSFELGQNPSIIWLLSKEDFYKRADQVMMNSNGLFGKWRQYADRENMIFMDDLKMQIDTIDQLLDTLERLNTTGNISTNNSANKSPLLRGSVIIYPDLKKILLAEVESSVLRMSPNDFVRMKQDHYNMKIEDLQRAKDEKIRAYRESLNKEASQGIYKSMRVNELQTLLEDFSSAQEQSFESSRQQLRNVLKANIDEFITCKHNLSNVVFGSKEYRAIHQGMFRYGLSLSESADVFYDRLHDLIESIHERHGIVIYLGGILSKNLKTSQLLFDNTLDVKDLSNNEVEQLIDQHLIKLCYPRSSKTTFRPANVVSTSIPNKLSISSYKLSAAEKERKGLHGKWCIDDTYKIDTLVDWVK
ncbi:MAG: hypothetical protein HeimC2_31400 [Candidatus Heimdallarchaeota archaeon LC_2]|nr:MAG: hypothetical protein HeimC2_31400 [Candidatus Heimdallarchaeota archaeon LC_2]